MKNAIIGVLILIILGLVGFIIYDNIKDSEPEPKLPEAVAYKAYKTGKTGEVDIVYYNPVANVGCTEEKYENNSDQLGLKGCLKWYVIRNSTEDMMTVRIMLDHSISSNTYLSMVTEEGFGVLKNKKVTDELAEIKKDGSWNLTPTIISTKELRNIMSLDDINGISLEGYEWLYDNMAEWIGDNQTVGIGFGYWISGDESVFDGYIKAYMVSHNGEVYSTLADDESYQTPLLRPVLIVDKTDLY